MAPQSAKTKGKGSNPKPKEPKPKAAVGKPKQPSEPKRIYVPKAPVSTAEQTTKSQSVPPQDRETKTKKQRKRSQKNSRKPREAPVEQGQKETPATAQASAPGSATEAPRDQVKAVVATSKTKGELSIANTAAAEDKNPRIPLSRPWVITKELKSIFETRFPAYEFRQSPNQLPCLHGHALSALERAATEDIMYKDIMRNHGHEVQITDIGGNAKRHHGSRPNIHCCCPLLSPPDVLRNSRYEGLNNYCERKVEDCDVPVDVYMAVHSLYYLDPQTVCNLVHRSRKQELVASVHKFVEGYGAFHYNGKEFESSYEMISESTVAQSVKGNDHGSYTHNNMLWLEQSMFYDKKGKRGITWGFRKYGDTYVYTFKPCPFFPSGKRLQKLTISEALHHPDYVGSVDLGVEQYRPVVEMLSLTETTVKSYGPLFWTTSKQHKLFVPKHLVNQRAYFMVGKPRDKDSWHMCVREGKKLLKNDSVNIPSVWRVRLAIYLPALAFVTYLGAEIAAFNTLIQPKHILMYQRANQLFSLTPDPTPIITRMCNAIKAPFRCRSTVRAEVDFAHEEMVHEYNHNRVSLPVISAKARSATNFLTTTSTRALSTMRAKAKVIKHEVCNKIDKKKLTQHTTAFSGYIPIVSTSNQANEEIAIRNRVACETPKVDDYEWDCLMADFKTKSRIDLSADRVCFDLDKMFGSWNSKFPKGRAANQLKAWEKLKTTDLAPKDFVRKFFVKVEKLMKSTPNGYEEFNPRAIQGATDEANVSLSPFIAQVSKLVAEDWDGKKCEFFYTAGATGTRIGQWMQDNYQPGDWIVEVDFSTYDGTQGERVQDLIDHMMVGFGIDDYGNAREVLNHHRHIRGFSPNGLEYHVDFNMCSGNPNTSVSNSTTTGLTSRHVLEKVFSAIKSIAVMGDDNTAIIPACAVFGKDMQTCKEEIVAGFLKFGFIAKVQIHESVAKAEFCSGIFWPCKVDGVETFVLGPKPGKMLPKVPYTLKEMKPEEIKGMLLGLETTCYFVPVARKYVEEMLRKLAAFKAAHWEDPSTQYKVGFGGHSGNVVEPSALLADFFCERYDLDMSVVEESLVSLLRSSDLLETVHWSFLDALVAVDN